MNVNDALNKLAEMAARDERLRERLIATENASDPMDEFCKIASESGCEISIGELFVVNETMLGNILKSTNGGADYPIENWGDGYEQFISALKMKK